MDIGEAKEILRCFPAPDSLGVDRGLGSNIFSSWANHDGNPRPWIAIYFSWNLDTSF